MTLLLLEAARSGSLGKSQIAEETREDLFEASLGVIYCAVAEHKIAQNTRGATSGGDRLQALLNASPAEGKGLPTWERRLADAIECMDHARSRSSDKAVADLIEALIEKTKELAIVSFEEAYDGKVYIGPMTVEVESYLRSSLDYGVIPYKTLSIGLAQDLRIQKVVQEALGSGARKPTGEQLEKMMNVLDLPLALSQVDAGHGVIFSVCPEKLSTIALMTTSWFREGDLLWGVDSWTSRTMEILDKADAAAKAARLSSTLSDYLESSYISCLLYWTAVRSLDGILERYDRKGMNPPSDLIRERQVAEENRNEINLTLEDSCEGLFIEPAWDLVSRLGMMERNPTDDEVRNLLVDGLKRNPVFPRSLSRWAEAYVNDLLRDRHDLFLGGFDVLETDLYNLLTKGLRSSFLTCFDDELMTQALVKTWNRMPSLKDS